MKRIRDEPDAVQAACKLSLYDFFEMNINLAPAWL